MTTETRVGPVPGAVGYGIPVTEEQVKEEPFVRKATGRRWKVEDLTYGEPVYWATLIGAVLAVIGGVVAFCTKANYIKPSYWISSVWQGQSVEEIWEGAVGSEPQGHWYLSHLLTGDGLTSAGFALCFIAITLGLIAAGIVLWKKRSRVFAIFAFIASLIMTVSIFGLLPE